MVGDTQVGYLYNLQSTCSAILSVIQLCNTDSLYHWCTFLIKAECMLFSLTYLFGDKIIILSLLTDIFIVQGTLLHVFHSTDLNIFH